MKHQTTCSQCGQPHLRREGAGGASDGPQAAETCYASAGIFLLLYGAYMALVLITASDLPERVATHFGFEGQADGWMSRRAYLIFESVFPLLIGVILVGVTEMARRLPAQYVNLPRKDFWLIPERRNLTVTILRNRMLWLGCLMTLFFGGLHILTLYANKTQSAQLSMGGMLLLVISFLTALMVWVVFLLMRFAETGEGHVRE